MLGGCSLGGNIRADNYSGVFCHQKRSHLLFEKYILALTTFIRKKDVPFYSNFLHSCSVKFLADTYLKYIGWMLYDKVGEVRVACLNVLEPLYSDPDTAPHLELFTEKFKVSKFNAHPSVCT